MCVAARIGLIYFCQNFCARRVSSGADFFRLNVPQVSTSDHTLVIRARGVVELLPAILDALRAVGAHPGEVRLRANTLEDVFISLTGRRLRE